MYVQILTRDGSYYMEEKYAKVLWYEGAIGQREDGVYVDEPDPDMYWALIQQPSRTRH